MKQSTWNTWFVFTVLAFFIMFVSWEECDKLTPIQELVEYISWWLWTANVFIMCWKGNSIQKPNQQIYGQDNMAEDNLHNAGDDHERKPE